MLVWLNGRVLPARRARVSALDRGLLHGDGVYDTWRTYGGEPFAIVPHLRRLAAACRALRLPPPEPATAWVGRTRTLLRRNRLPDAAVRLTITRGASGDAILPRREGRPTVLLTIRPLPSDLAQQQERGVRVALLPFPRDNGAPWGGVKLLGHASAVVGRTLAARRGAQEGLYVTSTGEVTEGTTATLFVVARGQLITPPLTAGVLPGVTREAVLRLARRARIPVVERPIPIARLLAAGEIFLTASTIEIVPVVRVDDRIVGPGRPGPITRRLQSLYATWVARATRGRASAASDDGRPGLHRDADRGGTDAVSGKPRGTR